MSRQKCYSKECDNFINVFKLIFVPQKWKHVALIRFTIFQMHFRIVFMISPCWRQKWPHLNAHFLTKASKGKEYGGIKERNWKNQETSNYIIREFFWTFVKNIEEMVFYDKFHTLFQHNNQRIAGRKIPTHRGQLYDGRCWGSKIFMWIRWNKG